jgi:hypothetical protein
MIKMATKTEMSPADYWLSFCTEWDRLATEAAKQGQYEMADFFDELFNDAADVWAGLLGPISS